MLALVLPAADLQESSGWLQPPSCGCRFPLMPKGCSLSPGVSHPGGFSWKEGVKASGPAQNLLPQKLHD